MIKTYSYPRDKNIQLSTHFAMGEFVDSSDYVNIPYPSSVPIHDKLTEILEKVYEQFGCTRGSICSGYRSPAADCYVGGSGAGPHTLGIAVDVYFYKNGSPIPSRLVACFLQDQGIKGIGLNCGGNPNGTHIDMRGFGIWEGSFWYGDESKFDGGGNYVTVSDFYKYTGTSKSEVYGSSGSTSAATTTGATIRTVQQWLNKTYNLSLATDGMYGDQTRRALIKGLQNVLNVKFKAGLVVDGIFGKATKAAVRPLKRGVYGGYPSILQAFLICHGYDTGGFDGDFGARTESAVKTFQTVKGLSVTGIAERETFARLAE
jgi:hypothetical protein